jgi:hypothetical protein
MKQLLTRVATGFATVALCVCVARGAWAQDQPAPPEAAQPQQPQQPQEMGPAPQAAPPPPAGAQTVYNYPTGSWIYAADRGWVWVPAGTATTGVDGVPYAYLYTPAYGWTWYVSPWGWGRYAYGPWVAHPWHPVGWRGGWVARPHVIVRMGGRMGGARGWRR